jgi:hypothetical protein
VNNRIVSVALFALAAAAGLVLLRSPAPTSAPAAQPSPIGIPVNPPDAAPGSAESLVLTAALPQGGFVAAPLTDDLGDLDQAYEGRLPVVQETLVSLGLVSAGEPLVLAEGGWGSGGAGRLLLPIRGTPDPAMLGLAGLEWIRLNGGDAMSVRMSGDALAPLVRKADGVLQRVAASEQGPSDGPRLYRITRVDDGYVVLATLDIREED